jgi:hypothetical protein
MILSPGEEWRKVPTERAANLRWRKHVLTRARDDERVQAELIEVCRNDIIFWINTFVFQFNPDAHGDEQDEGPFVLYPFQAAALIGNDRVPYREAAGYDLGRMWGILECVAEREPLVIEKSRDLGASYLCLMAFDWLARFHRAKKLLCISRNKDMVDSDDSDSLFWKLDDIDRRLPDWMRMGRVKTKAKVKYVSTDGYVNGTATTKGAGIGGRTTATLIDEFGMIEEDRAIFEGLTNTTKCRIFNSTHWGTGTMFAELCNRPDWRKLVLHWCMHPEKSKGLYRWVPHEDRIELLDGFRGTVALGKDADKRPRLYKFPEEYPFVRADKPNGPFPRIRSPWYDETCLEVGMPAAIARNLDIDLTGSNDQAFDAVMIRRLVDGEAATARAPAMVGRVEWDRNTGEPTGFVKDEKGPLRLWCRLDGLGRPPVARYAAGADVGQGVGSTPSVLSLGNAAGEKVLEIVTAETPVDGFAAMVLATCRMFVSADGAVPLLVWENEGPGGRFGDLVLESGYPNYYTKNSAANRARNPMLSGTPGWSPKAQSKHELYSAYASALANGSFLNPSKEALLECLHFRFVGRTIEHARFKVKNDPSGATVNHGDRATADALLWLALRDFHKAEPKELPAPPPPPSCLASRIERAKREAAVQKGWGGWRDQKVRGR